MITPTSAIAAIMPRMDLGALRAHVGDELYDAARRWAWATAAGTGRSGLGDRDAEWPEAVPDVPHELEELIWEPEAQCLAKVELLFALYRDMPAYAHLMYAEMNYRRFDEAARRLFWAECRSLLEDPDDRLADPLCYSLWCGFFEHDAKVAAEAWRETTIRTPADERRLERVLRVSGPVRYSVKEPFYVELLSDPRWHEPILDGLAGSTFDSFGDVKPARALRLLDRLDLTGARSSDAEIVRTELARR